MKVEKKNNFIANSFSVFDDILREPNRTEVKDCIFMLIMFIIRNASSNVTQCFVFLLDVLLRQKAVQNIYEVRSGVNANLNIIL